MGPPDVCNLLCRGHDLHIVQGRSYSKCISVFKRLTKLQRPYLPTHKPLLLRYSSLPFARFQILKTLQFSLGSFHQALWPSAFAVFAYTYPFFVKVFKHTVCQASNPPVPSRQLPPSPLAVSLCCIYLHITLSY